MAYSYAQTEQPVLHLHSSIASVIVSIHGFCCVGLLALLLLLFQLMTGGPNIFLMIKCSLESSEHELGCVLDSQALLWK